jgi:hypothetical protein
MDFQLPYRICVLHKRPAKSGILALTQVKRKHAKYHIFSAAFAPETATFHPFALFWGWGGGGRRSSRTGTHFHWKKIGMAMEWYIEGHSH